MIEKLHILKAKSSKRVGVYVYLNEDDINRLDQLVEKTNTNRTDVMRQALRKIYEIEASNGC